MKKAFTLAEVLITLVVIGIVAAITINIIFNNQEEAYRSALKKSSSVLQQAFKKAIIDNGGFLPYNFDPENREIIDETASFIFNNYMKVGKDCGKVLCFKKGEVKMQNFNGTSSFGGTYESSTYYGSSFILQDGSFYKIPSLSKDEISIIVDVNGVYKGPNRLGRDVFYFKYDVDDERLIPGGSFNGHEQLDLCDKTSTKNWNGAGCTARVLRGEKLPR